MPPVRSPFARFREFVEFWHHDAPTFPCCQFASEEDRQAGDGVYDCDGSVNGIPCPVADALYLLDTDALNGRAWRLYLTAVSRLTVEGHALGIVLEKLTADCDREEFEELLLRLTVAFDTCNPPPEPTS